MTRVLGRKALNRALLRRQWLDAPVDAAPLAAIDHLAGLQAQLGDPPYYQLWSRLRGFRPADLSALLLNREAVRIAAMRGTVHLVSAADCGPLRRLVQPYQERALNSSDHGKKLVGVDYDALAAEARRVLADGPLGNDELGMRLTKRWPDHEAVHLAYGARCLLPLIQIPPRGVWDEGGALTYALAEQWLGEQADAAAEPESTVVRYLKAFGPASVDDYQKWSGVTRQRAVFARLRPRLVVYSDDEGKELFDVPDAALPDPDQPIAPRLVGPFDNLVLSHADRSRIIDDRGLAYLRTPNGQFPGMFLLDGFVAGLWRIDRTRKVATVAFEPFEPISKNDESCLEAEGRRLLGDMAPQSRQHRVDFARRP
ncbi:MAG: winged helix DNA-binding domain-containing protein [Stackebrandtia sp.]